MMSQNTQMCGMLTEVDKESGRQYRQRLSRVSMNLNGIHFMQNFLWRIYNQQLPTHTSKTLLI